MPNTSGTLETARLMKDIGIAVNMGYSCDLSRASGNAIVPALTDSFGYSSAEYIDYANTANYAVVEDNLNRNQPVIFTGIDYSLNPPGGHAWVSDGYIEQFYCVSGTTLGIGYLYFHMNWGWQLGDANGWFSFNTFTPTTSSGTIYSFYSDSKVVVNIHP
ncbi:MAG: hypothetical protein IEMM0006_2234 [bacterium]|nr:MAG: hypothetical protein IEMM0006_2234 [bacterium]